MVIVLSKPNNVSNETTAVLYTYWHELPFQKMVDAARYFNLTSNEVKNFIIKYIRDGVEDEYGANHGLQRRHAFSAKELKKAYDTSLLAKKYSISNFHFHIKNLVEDGFLQEIGKLLEGRHYVSYYGRTAITFVPQMDEMMTSTMNQNIFGPLKTIILQRHPELDPDYVDNIITDNLKQTEDFYERVFAWQKELYPLVYSSKLDLESFSQHAAHYAMIHSDFAGNLTKVSELIGLSDHLNQPSTKNGE